MIVSLHIVFVFSKKEFEPVSSSLQLSFLSGLDGRESQSYQFDQQPRSQLLLPNALQHHPALLRDRYHVFWAAYNNEGIKNKHKTNAFYHINQNLNTSPRNNRDFSSTELKPWFHLSWSKLSSIHVPPWKEDSSADQLIIINLNIWHFYQHKAHTW